MRAFAAAAAAALTVALVWPTGAEAAEARIDDFAFACTTPDGQTLKPKFGDVDGVFYTDLPGQREQCLETIKRKIALCRENVDFESNTKNEKHAGCLPLFAEQAEACVGHFEFERGKCDAGGPGPDEAGLQQDEATPADAYTVEPLDTVMEVARRANVRAGPGTDFDVIGTLDAGVGVRVTGQVEGGAWLRVDLREDGGAAFIHASLLKERAPEAPLEPFGPEWSIVTNQPCQVWNYGDPEYFEPSTWSGACVDGKASGQGRMTYGGGGDVYEGAMQAGKLHGHGTEIWANGDRYEGEFRDGEWHGRGTATFASGNRYEGEWRDGQQHGHGTYTWANGERYEGEYRDGKRHGHGTETWADGSRYEGEWRDGEWHGVVRTFKENGDRIDFEWRDGEIVRMVCAEKYQNYEDIPPC